MLPAPPRAAQATYISAHRHGAFIYAIIAVNDIATMLSGRMTRDNTLWLKHALALDAYIGARCHSARHFHYWPKYCRHRQDDTNARSRLRQSRHGIVSDWRFIRARRFRRLYAGFDFNLTSMRDLGNMNMNI